MTSPANKTALVTGASRGIGRATAEALATAGAHVIVHYGRAAAEAHALVAGIRAAGGSADAAQADLSTPEGAAALANQVRAIVGQRYGREHHAMVGPALIGIESARMSRRCHSRRSARATIALAVVCVIAALAASYRSWHQEAADSSPSLALSQPSPVAQPPKPSPVKPLTAVESHELSLAAKARWPAPAADERKPIQARYLVFRWSGLSRSDAR